MNDAVEGSWNDAGDGRGIFDPDQWIVVFKYSRVELEGYNSRVEFVSHRSGAPVVWLVSGDVTIDGTLVLDGSVNNASGGAPGGPGGFRGGFSEAGLAGASGGFGPGGGRRIPPNISGGASYGTLAGGPGESAGLYGDSRILPLIGGSGAAGISTFGGGGGGGAILIGATGTILISDGGLITANGAYNGYTGLAGSGGAIRLVADRVIGNGSLLASAYGAGGRGRIRVETRSGFESSIFADPVPALATVAPNDPVKIVPDATHPVIRVKKINAEPIPNNPSSSLDFGLHQLTLPNIPSALIELETENVPLGWIVVVRVTPRSGPDVILPATLISGDQTRATWEAVLDGVACGFSVVQARAYRP